MNYANTRHNTRSISLIFRTLAGIVSFLYIPVLIETIITLNANHLLNIDYTELATHLTQLYVFFLFAYVAVIGQPPKHWKKCFGSNQPIK